MVRAAHDVFQRQLYVSSFGSLTTWMITVGFTVQESISRVVHLKRGYGNLPALMVR